MPEIYAVLNCDLKGSKKLTRDERSKAQEAIHRTIDYLSERFPYLGPMAFDFRWGDEWQLFVTKPEKSYTIYSSLQYLLGFPFYCGIGIGEISTQIKNVTHEMDGPAFHLARFALEEAKQSNLAACYRLNGIPQGLDVQTLLQVQANLLARLRSGRRNSQEVVAIETFIDPALSTNMRAEILAERWGIHRTSAYRRLQSAGVFEELEVLKATEQLLLWYCTSIREHASEIRP